MAVAATVTPAAPAPGFRVLTQDFADRLALMNRASRKLRELGYHVTSHQFVAGGGRPELHIAPGLSRSIEPLMKRGARGIERRKEAGHSIVYAVFMGVLVRWVEL